jgi:membrane protein required for colicin V production
MNWVDGIILGIVGVSLLAGLARGAVRTVLSIAGVAIGFVVATRESGAVGMVFARWMPESAAAVAGFLFVFLGISLAFALVGWLLRRVLTTLALSWLDRLAGGLLGLARGAVIVGVLALAVEGLGGLSAGGKSDGYGYALRVGGVLLELVPEETRERMNWDRLRDWIPEATRHWNERLDEAI